MAGEKAVHTACDKYKGFERRMNGILTGVNYFCAMRKLSMEELGRQSVEEVRLLQKYPVIIILENIRSAYNVGSIFRTSDAFLVEAIYICGYSARPPHKEIKKTALGAEETVSWISFKTSVEAIHQAKENGYKVYAVEQADKSIKLQNLEPDGSVRLAFVLGNEVTGVEQSTLDSCDGCIEIPQMGMKHSLNVATAAGVVLWEVIRGKLKAEIQKAKMRSNE